MLIACNYLVKDLIPTEGIAQYSNTIDLQLSFLTRFAPMNLTTEIKVLTKEVRTDPLFREARLVLDNASTPLPIVELVPARLNISLDYTVVLEREVPMEAGPVPEIAGANDWPIKSRYSIKTAPLMAAQMAEAPCDLHSILQDRPSSFFNNDLSVTRVWLDLSLLNDPILEIMPKGSPAKLVYQQLRETAQAEAQEMRAILTRFQTQLERLISGLPQPAFSSTGGAIRVRGKLLGSWKERGIEGTIVNKKLNRQEKVSFQVTRGPEIREGDLLLSLTAPRWLIGRIANIILSIEGKEILLGVVAIESDEGDAGRIELEVDLQSIGVRPKDGRLAAEAFQIVVEQQ